MAKRTSCGVIVTDGVRVLLGHATRSPRWDIPKGLAEPGESFAAAAVRELAEETGLAVSEAELRPFGVHHIWATRIWRCLCGCRRRCRRPTPSYAARLSCCPAARFYRNSIGSACSIGLKRLAR
ncbi:MAG TPA: NUDIX hydrolase [Acetobacteraceae bacterium]|nr:NUDIX hydrolase [Acetobacteraceae bacterium]